MQNADPKPSSPGERVEPVSNRLKTGTTRGMGKEDLRRLERADVYGKIVALARSGGSRHRFFSKALACIARSYASPYAAVHVRYASEVFQDDCHTGPTDPQFWKASLQRFLTESLIENKVRAKLLKAKSGDTKVAFMSTPLFDASASPIGALALVVTSMEDEEEGQRVGQRSSLPEGQGSSLPSRLLSGQLAKLEALGRLTSYLADCLGQVDRGGPAGRSTPGGRTSAAHGRALSHAAACESTEELSFAITNELRNKTGCEQVILGLVVRRRVRVVSISGLDEVRPQSPGVTVIRSAMEECLDAGAPIVDQRGSDDERILSGYRLHRQWQAAAKGDAVASMPLQVGDRTVAILSMRRRADRPFDREFIDDVQVRVAPFASALTLLQKADRGLIRHARDSVRSTVEVLTGPGRYGPKLLTALALSAVVWFMCGSMDYQLTVPCVVTPAQIRHVSAPFDGVISAAPVVAGDRVSKGDLLCGLDSKDIERQRAQLAAELAVLQREQDRAMAAGTPAEVQLALANQQLVKTGLDIVGRRIEQATLRAPIDGVVVRGDLRKRVGGVVVRGEPLFELAPLDRWTLEMEIPESAAADVSCGLGGVFASHARPDRTRKLTVSRVHFAAVIRDQKNVYVAEAHIDAREDWLRPGMAGVAKIHVGRRPIRWVALHRVIDYLRMKLWL